jgi:hypothetical protein
MKTTATKFYAINLSCTIIMFVSTLLIGLAIPAAAQQKGESAFSQTQLAERTIHRRAIEAMNWGMSAVNFDLMYQAFIRDAHGGDNQVVYWSRPFGWKNQTLTPNPDVIYLMPFFNTKDVGPMVLEIPPAGEGSITGSIMDCWQSALEDVGPAGADKGKGARYLILPPGYGDKEVPPGYIVLTTYNYKGYALLRSILKSGSDADIQKAVSYAKRIRLYPLSQGGNPPATRFVDAIDVVYEATIPYDVRFFQSLDHIIQTEPWFVRDKAMIDVLKSVGIEKGKTFNPDPARQEILNAAAIEAHAWLNARYETRFTPYYDGRQWFSPGLPDLLATMGSFFEKVDTYAVDDRGLIYYFAFSSVKHLGAGQFYLFDIKDNKGQSFSSGKTYRLTVPANAPVKQFWSVVVYDRTTHSLIRDMSRSSRSSQSPDMKKNADGSTDVYFGPTAPAGKEANWIPTAGGNFEVLFRFYGPDKPVFDKTWKLPDIEEVKSTAGTK